MEEKKEDNKGLWNRLFKKSRIKKGKVAILYLKNNGIAESVETESKKGFFNIQGKTYHEDSDCVYNLRIGNDRFPLAIIPEWSMIPYGTKKWHDKPMIEKFSELQDHTLRGIRHAELVRMGSDRDGVKMNAKSWILIGIVVIVCVAFIWGYM